MDLEESVRPTLKYWMDFGIIGPLFDSNCLLGQIMMLFKLDRAVKGRAKEEKTQHLKDAVVAAEVRIFYFIFFTNFEDRR